MIQEYVMGIDEAGRGPVLGPLVYGTVFCNLTFKDKVKQVFKVKDSKKMTAQSRSSVYRQMDAANDDVSYFVRVVSADEISQKMLRRQKYNLNQMSYDCAISLIKEVLAEMNKKNQIDPSVTHVLKEVYVDTVGKEDKYQTRLEEEFPNIDTIVVAAKADDKYPIVSAASIVAKVTRDALVEQLSEDEVGSGYPGDKVTKKWLTDNSDPVFGYDADLVRFSWGTVTKLLKDDKFAEMEWSDDDDEDEEMAENQMTFSFAINTGSKLSKEEKDKNPKYRDDFYNVRGLKIISNF